MGGFSSRKAVQVVQHTEQVLVCTAITVLQHVVAHYSWVGDPAYAMSVRSLRSKFWQRARRWSTSGQ